MTYPANFMRLQVNGTLYDSERFSWGLNFAQRTGSTPPRFTSVPVGLLEAIQDFWTTATVAPVWAKIDQIKWNLVGPDGRYVYDAEAVTFDYTTPVPGAAGGFIPPQCATAYTLHTSAARGRASRGRFYIPYAGGQGADGRLTLTSVNAWRAAAGTMLNTMLTEIPDYYPAVLSSIGSGVERPIIGVSVGRVVDTIRSRRRSMSEENPAPTPVVPFP